MSSAAFVLLGGRGLPGQRQGGRGKEWTGRSLGLKVEIVNRLPKSPPEKVLRTWAREWFKERHEMDLSKLPIQPGFENLPRRWVDERTFAWIF